MNNPKLTNLREAAHAAWLKALGWHEARCTQCGTIFFSKTIYEPRTLCLSCESKAKEPAR